MSKQKWLRLAASILVMWCFCFAIGPSTTYSTVQAFTARTLTYGSQGYDVDELQGRLKFIGYYKGRVDGQYGWKTYWAVRNFQSRFGMKVDGVVAMKTKMKLANASRNWHYTSTTRASKKNSPTGNSQTNSLPTVPGVSQSDIRLMEHVVYGEARGEPFTGEVAIAAVILNRIRDPRFPHNVPGIIYQPGAFTCVADGQVNLQPDARAERAVMEAVHGSDPSHGAVYYFNPATATSGWMWSRPQICKIGKHIFCR